MFYQLQDAGNPLLQNTKLSIDGLFNTFFPKHTIKGTVVYSVNTRATNKDR